MNKLLQKSLALLLCVHMVLGMFPVTYAEGEEGEHVHQFVYDDAGSFATMEEQFSQYELSGHREVCECGEEQTVFHKGNACKTCGYQAHPHAVTSWEIFPWGHSGVCADCGFHAQMGHRMNPGKDVCTVCGYGACEHDWADATCTTPKTCKICGTTEGEANGHDCADATCTAPSSCKNCDYTDGEALGHDWVGADCTTAGICSRCNETGKALGHQWQLLQNENYAAVNEGHYRQCAVCQEQEWESHNMENAPFTCTFCGVKVHVHQGQWDGQPAHPTYEQQIPTYEATGHGAICSICNEYFDVLHMGQSCSVCGYINHDGPHNFKTVYAVYDYGHEMKCTDCNYVNRDGHHMADNGACQECGYHIHRWEDATCSTPKTCKLCQETEGEALGHTWEVLGTYPESHSAQCSVCGTHNDDEHTFDPETRLCSICGYKKCSHVHGEKPDSFDEENHFFFCEKCYMEISVPHEWDEAETTCTVCGYFVHEHNWQWNGVPASWAMGVTAHPEECTVCHISRGYMHEGNTSCEICSYVNHSHNCTIPFETNPGMHALKCADCGYLAWDMHSMNGEGKCTVCGFDRACEHSSTVLYETVLSMHAFRCEDCGHISWDRHSLNEKGECTVCGYGACEHDWADATCTTPKTCSYCQATEGEALGHSWQDATCTEAKTCKVCKTTDGEALGHSWQDATCTEAKTCSRCKTTDGEALGHSWQDATCTEAKTCKVCKTTEGEALGHSWQDATCTEAKTCKVCKTTDGEALGHSWQDATCTEAKTCSHCQTTDGEALGHDWVGATCTAAGICSRCNETGKALGHQWQLLQNENYAAVNEGHYRQCAVCQEQEWESHDMENAPFTCTFCGVKVHVHQGQWDGQPAHPTYEQQIPTYEATGHGAICSICNEYFDVLHMGQSCTVCGYINHDGPHNFKTVYAVYDYGHEMKCTDCNYVNRDGHHMADNGACQECGYHTHRWEDATCTTPKTCSICEATEGEALGHSWQNATCTEAKTCSHCQTTEGTALGHSWTEATCTQPSYCKACRIVNPNDGPKGHDLTKADCISPASCRNCDYTEGQPIGHDWLNATCDQPATCARCHETTGGNPLGHSWQDATCTDAKTCTRCGASEGQPLGHSWQDATCAAPETCSVCPQTRGAAKKHTLNPADCTTAAVCTVCGKHEGEPLAHIYRAATCIDPEICNTCGQKKPGSVPLGHTMDGNTCSTCGHQHSFAVTITSDTQHKLTCMICGEALLQNHDITENSPCTVCNYANHAHDANEVRYLSTTQHVEICSRCRQETTVAHDENCPCIQQAKAALVQQRGENWELDQSGKLNITGDGAAITKDDLTDLEPVESLAVSIGVKEIGENAFANLGDLELVSLPSTVNTIGSGAMTNCAEVYIMNRAAQIGDNAFAAGTIVHGYLYSTAWEYCQNHEGLIFEALDEAETPVVIPGLTDEYVSKDMPTEAQMYVTGEKNQLQYISVDGHKLTENQDYYVTEGSVVAHLYPSFLETLSLGSHTMTMAFLGTSASDSAPVAVALNVGTNAHHMSLSWSSENGKHFHVCTDEGCTYREDEAACSGGTATCQTAAVCQICQRSYGTLASHNMGEATCTKPAACKNCGYEDESGALSAHTWVAATCAAPKTCSVCNATEGKALGHRWTEATCAAPKTCTVCKITEGSSLPHQWAEATCKVPETCKVCGAIHGNPAAHQWVDGTCKVCGKVLEKDHIHKLIKAAGKDATCTEEGSSTYYACACGQWYEDVNGKTPIHNHNAVLLPATGHQWKKADCSAPKTCTVCQLTEGEVLGHAPTDSWAGDEDAHVQRCSRCDEVLDRQSHVDSNGDLRCDVCGYSLGEEAAESAANEAEATQVGSHGVVYVVTAVTAVLAAAAAFGILRKKRRS